ncbi:4'-phosphopantetheinyl transferase superfamily protein [Coraliomargarita algicola]|uniref:Enterobactin synthase component D n=1 Tax=Coraliomargarita algicola TaxID=3092156 RepID=A0ABZ0RHV7_9BACT|nr:4'-phosphopantetheinyl transferase superfamily protein [Coraliomargarita sp. J2-16]WPJ94839.1 4'-phosphopantetheinyl transferase superfamily protein [Coraliomargarita sp. J2-16]
MSNELTLIQLRRALADIAPSACAFELALVGDHLEALSEAERLWVNDWGVHRQCEFSTGRRCARDVLSALEVDTGDLLPDADGIPQWPEGVVGCISHSRGLAMAIASRGGAPFVLGLDLEKTNRLSEAAMKKVVHPMEESFVSGDQVRASVLFSLKEAFYKAQFPHWRIRGNFQDMGLEVDLASGVAKVSQLDVRFAPELRQLRFSFRLVDDYVVSLCWS